MAIELSGEISLGVNATVTRSVACELGLGGTTQICMDQTEVRALAARTGAGTSICFCDFYGKSSGPEGLGCVFEGGYYTGAVSSPANYYLIIAPNATGCACCQWKGAPSLTLSPCACSCTDGFANTYNGLNASIHRAGNFTATRSINGFSDWYLPAKNELNVLYVNKDSMPVGERYDSVVQFYWSSTQDNTNNACVQSFGTGCIFRGYKEFTRALRAVRRVSF